MTELERLKDHMRESFGLQLDRLPDNHSMFFGTSRNNGGYVDIPVLFNPTVDPQDAYIAVDYNIEGSTIKATDWSGMLRNDVFKHRLDYDQLLDLAKEIWAEVEGKKPSVIGHQTAEVVD